MTSSSSPSSSDWDELATLSDVNANQMMEIFRLRELALIFLRNLHLVARPDHEHLLADDCPEDMFVHLRSQIGGEGSKTARVHLWNVLTSTEYGKMEAEGQAAEFLGLEWDDQRQCYWVKKVRGPQSAGGSDAVDGD